MRRPLLAVSWLLLASTPSSAGRLRLSAYDERGEPLSARGLLRRVSPETRTAPGGRSLGLRVTDLDGNPVGGRPWWVEGSSVPAVEWRDSVRVQLSLPWPIAQDGFSTVYLDKGGKGYADGDEILLNEEIAEAQHLLLQQSLNARRSSWTPPYRPGRKTLRLLEAAKAAMEAARAAPAGGGRARLYEEALPAISLAWSKVLFEHGGQAAAHPKLGPTLRRGLTLDESLLDRLPELDGILGRLEASGANWVRLVFRLNPGDFEYKNQRSFNEYDRVVEELAARKIHVMGSVLDSRLWPAGLEPEALARRAENLARHYLRSVRSWEAASEPNGNWLGGSAPLPERTVLEAFTRAAAAVKGVDPSLETAATLYWWEGTAGDDAHPLFAWLKRAIPSGAFREIDLVGLSVFPDQSPLGLALDPVFRRLSDYFPEKRLMLGALGYAEEGNPGGYWWFDPKDADGARQDLLILYTGAACAMPRSVGGGFWWHALDELLASDERAQALRKTYRDTLKRLGR